MYTSAFLTVQRTPPDLRSAISPSWLTVLLLNTNWPSGNETSYKQLLPQLLNSLCSFSCHETIFHSWYCGNTHLEETCVCPFERCWSRVQSNCSCPMASGVKNFPFVCNLMEGQGFQDVLLSREERNMTIHDIFLLV